MQCRVCPAAIPSQSSKTSPASTQTAVIEDRDLHPPRRSHRRQRPASTPTHSSKTETRIHPDAVIEDRDPHPPRRSHRRQRPAPNTTQSSKTETCTHHDAVIEDRDLHPPRRSHRRQRPAPTTTQSSKMTPSSLTPPRAERDWCGYSQPTLPKSPRRGRYRTHQQHIAPQAPNTRMAKQKEHVVAPRGRPCLPADTITTIHRSLPDSPLLERILHHRRNQLHKPGFNRPRPGVVHPRRPQTPIQARNKRNLHPPPRQHHPHPPGPLTPHAITPTPANSSYGHSMLHYFQNPTHLSFALYHT